MVIRYAGGAPWLLNAVLTGWLIGQRRVGAVLGVEVGANLAHILLDLALVLWLGLGVAGVAAATLTSETLKCAALAAAALGGAPAARLLAAVRARDTWRAPAFALLFRLNRDLFGRTALLMTATVLLTRAGARQGAVILAANAILYQLFMLSALILDGFESAAQVLCGEIIGAGAAARFAPTVRRILFQSALAAALIALAYALCGPLAATAFSRAPAVSATVARYGAFAAALPLAGAASYVFDGVFIGAGWTRAMLLTMAAALAGFALALALAAPLGDGGLWAAFILFLLLRGLGQGLVVPTLTKRAFAGRPAPDGASGS